MKKRILSFILLIGLLSGCGGETASPAQPALDEIPAELPTQPETNSSETAQHEIFTYKASYQDLTFDTSAPINIKAYCVLDSQLFFSGSCVTGTEVYTDKSGMPHEISSYEEAMFRANLDTGEAVRLEFYQNAEMPDHRTRLMTNICGMAAREDGTIWILETNYFDTVLSTCFTLLRQLDADGRELKSIETPMLDNKIPNQFLMDQAGNFYINTFDSIYLLDPEGVLLSEQINSSRSQIFQISTDEICMIDNSEIIQILDLEGAQDAEPMECPDDALRLFPGVGQYRYLYDFYGDSVYGYNQESGQSERLFSWLDYGVCPGDTYSCLVLEDGRIFTVVVDYQSRSRFELVLLSPVDASLDLQRQELTLACVNLDVIMSHLVADFNRLHDDVRIVVNDYGVYNTEEDETVGMAKLYTELLSGEGPDILCTKGLPADQYSAMGFLTDLWPLIDGDEEFSRDDLMLHLFDVLTIEGQLFQLPESFTLCTTVGNADIIGNRTGWTLDDLLETLKRQGEDTAIFGPHLPRKAVVLNCIGADMGTFMNWKEKTCSFDSQAFVDRLNFFSLIPEFGQDYTSDGAEELESTLVQSGRQLLLIANIPSFGAFLQDSINVGGNPCFVGYPSAVGGGSQFSLGNSLSITASCQDVDAAWSFVRTLLTEAHQSSFYIYGFPTNRHLFEAMAEELMTPEYQVNPETGALEEAIKGSYGTDEMAVSFYAMTQEEYDLFMTLYASCTTVSVSNHMVEAIINEEAALFFDGQKTAEDAAKSIQARVSLYMDGADE